MMNLSRRAILKLSAALALLPLPLVSVFGRAGAPNIKMLTDCQVLGYMNSSTREVVPCHDWPAGSVWRVPEEITEDWAEVLLRRGLAERL